MPYSAEHKKRTRATIIEAARTLFNIHGFQDVTIDMVMQRAGLTRGGFYNHFKNKEALFAAAVRSFLSGRGAQWREDAGIDLSDLKPEMATQMLESYLSSAHQDDVEGQCPMVALPSDIARVSPDARLAYQELLTAMIWLYENTLEGPDESVRERALAMAALCVGGMVIARTLPGSSLSTQVREAAFKAASDLRDGGGVSIRSDP